MKNVCTFAPDQRTFVSWHLASWTTCIIFWMANSTYIVVFFYIPRPLSDHIPRFHFYFHVELKGKKKAKKGNFKDALKYPFSSQHEWNRCFTIQYATSVCSVLHSTAIQLGLRTTWNGSVLISRDIKHNRLGRPTTLSQYGAANTTSTGKIYHHIRVNNKDVVITHPNILLVISSNSGTLISRTHLKVE